MAISGDNFEVDGFVAQRKELEALLMSNPEMEKRVQGLIRKVLLAARRTVAQAAQGKMRSDPRQAYKAVRTTVYRRILGGNVNILNKRRAGGSGNYEPQRTLRPGQRGGNRRSRSQRTRALQGYQGSDRGFILRFLNAGTEGRAIEFKYDEARENVKRGSQGGDKKKYGKTINTGYRGNIAPRNFFGQRSHREMEAAASNLEKMIDDLIKEELNK